MPRRHHSYGGSSYHDADSLWQNLGYGHGDYTLEEQAEGRAYFDGFLFDVEQGYRPEASFNFWDFLDYYGLDYEDFDWDEFRDWYDAQ